MTDARPQRWGVLDWGIGGLDVVRKLRDCGDTSPVLYVSDAGSTPYGRQPAMQLARRVAALLRWMRAQGCTKAVIGCNAASTVLSEDAVATVVSEGFEVHGVIDVAVDAIAREGQGKILVIGGERTVRSDCHAKALQRRSIRPRKVVTRVAQPLSALIEAGVLEGPALESCLAGIFDGVTDATTLVSACTHYVAVEAAMRRRLPHLRVLIDPARLLAASLASPLVCPVVCPAVSPVAAAMKPGADRFVTTGDPRASTRAAKAAFGMNARFEAAAAPPHGPPVASTEGTRPSD